MNKYIFFLIFSFSFLSDIVSAANNDSLLKVVLNKKLPDSVRQKTEKLIVNELVYSDPQLALKHILIIEKSLQKENNLKWLAEIHWKKGIIYRELNDNKKAITSLFDALDFAEKSKDGELKSKVYNSLGSLYYNQKKYDEAKSCFEKSFKISKESNEMSSIADALINMGAIELNLKNYQDAIQYTREALPIYLDLKDKDGEGYVYSNLGSLYQKMEILDSSNFYFKKALEIFLPFNNNRSIVNMYNNLGLNLLRKNELSEALRYCKMGYKIAKESKLTSVRRSSCQCLYSIYEKKNDYVNAYTYLVEYHQIKDSLFDEESISENARRETQFKYKETQLADSIKREAKKEKEDAETKLRHDQEVQEQKLYTYVGIGIAFVALAFLIFVYRGLRQKKRANLLLEEKNSLIQKQKKDVETQKLIIEEKHKEINDSINYAERLQRSLMASKNLLDSKLSPSGGGEGGGYFIYFNPKEVVSGDFYWADELKNGNFLLACADSTGHGVPGAMMSMMNMNSLKEAVKEGFTQPNEILNQTRKIIIETLANDGSEEGGKDGMDAALLSFDFKNNKLNFALANNPLWLIRPSTNSGTNELIEYSPDKMPVGKHDRQNISFSNHEIDLKKGDFIFVFTDGYADQFGGEKGKKLKYSGLKNILVANATQELEFLKAKLNDDFEVWKKDLEQVDDVCIIGVKI